MTYVEMSIEDALKYSRKGKRQMVLVAVGDLESETETISFVKKSKPEAERIIKQAETIALAADELMDILKCYTEKQDIYHIKPVGKMSTILFPPSLKE